MTWTPEVWTENPREVRVFDHTVFDLAPIFDTGSTAGVWIEAETGRVIE